MVGLSDDYLKTQLAAQGVKDLRRIRRRLPDGTFVNTPTIILTISGTVIPEHVDFGWTRCKTRNYYPSPMLCFHCWSFGHTGKRCTEPQRTCGRCCKIHPEDQAPAAAENEREVNAHGGLPSNSQATNRFLCSESFFCKNCKTDDHPVSSRKCPVYLKEVEIQKIRIDCNIPYPQARREFEARQNASTSTATFSGVVVASKDAEIESLKAAICQMQEDAKKKDVRMAEMEIALRGPSVGQRLDMVREHGTIEQLIKQVADLTATVQKLQETIESKDKIIAKLMTERLPVQEEIVPPAIFSISDSQEEIPVSQDSMDFIPATANPTLEAKIQNWIDQTTSGNANSSSALEDTRTKNKKDKRHKKRNKTPTDDYTFANESVSSMVSQTSQHTNNITLVPNKRNRDGSDSSNGSYKVPNLRRNSKTRKQETKS